MNTIIYYCMRLPNMPKDKRDDSNQVQKQETKPKKVTFYSFKSSNPWEHNAIKVDDEYISIYPKAHIIPEEEKLQKRKFRDEDDISAKLLEIKEFVDPMISNDMVFEDKSEIKNTQYRKTKIAVTDEQYNNIRELVKQQKELAEKKEVKYSVFTKKGDSCAAFTQKVIETIAESEEEKKLAKPSLIEKHVVMWPQNTFDRAKNIADLREGKPVQIPQERNTARYFAGKFNESQADKLERIRGIKKSVK